MIFEEIYNDIIDSFNSLWKFKVRGNSLEIITPFATTNHSFVSVFLTKQDENYIISDGGWIDTGIYENQFNLEEESFRRIITHYQSSLNILETKNNANVTYFYKKTNKVQSIPSLVFDLSHFVSTIVSASYVQFTDKEERESNERFKSIANDFIRTFSNGDNIKFNQSIGENQSIKINAIIQKTSSNIVLINYITGSTPSNYNNSISKTNMLFELADLSSVAGNISKKISLIDDSANGYNTDKINTFLYHLQSKSTIYKWSERENLTF
jgi:hypothetical protein